jgi:hypothetical protein
MYDTTVRLLETILNNQTEIECRTRDFMAQIIESEVALRFSALEESIHEKLDEILVVVNAAPKKAHVISPIISYAPINPHADVFESNSTDHKANGQNSANGFPEGRHSDPKHLEENSSRSNQAIVLHAAASKAAFSPPCNPNSIDESHAVLQSSTQPAQLCAPIPDAPIHRADNSKPPVSPGSASAARPKPLVLESGSSRASSAVISPITRSRVNLRAANLSGSRADYGRDHEEEEDGRHRSRFQPQLLVMSINVNI